MLNNVFKRIMINRVSIKELESHGRIWSWTTTRSSSKIFENFMETKTSPAAINTIKVTGTRKSNFSCNFKELLIETRNGQSKLYYQRLTFGREIIHRKGNYWNRWALIGGECVIHDAEKAIERMEMIDEIGKHFFCYPVSRIVKE